jgi:hypothetical protein
MKRYLAIAALVALTGCGSTKITPAESVLLSCDAFASALSVLAPMRAEGKLSDGTVKLVDQTRTAVDPICEGDAPDVDASVKSLAVDNGVKLLTGIAAQFLK